MVSKSFRKLLGTLAAGALLLSGVAFIASEAPDLIESAEAGVYGGGGGTGSGGGGGAAGAIWVQTNFASIAKDAVGGKPSDWNNAVCQSDYQIFVLVSNNSRIIESITNPNDPWTLGLWGVGGYNASGALGGSAVVSALTAVGEGEGYMYEKNLICISDPDVIEETQTRYKVVSSSSSDAFSFYEPYSFVTTIAPQPISDGKGKKVADPVGAENLNAQSSAQKTNYAKVWDEFIAATQKSGANAKDLAKEYKKKFRDAINADKGFDRGDVDLNESNQAGLAEGGILNVDQSRRMAAANVSTTTTKYQLKACPYARWSKSGWRTNGSCSNASSAPSDAVWLNSQSKKDYESNNPRKGSWTKYASSVGSVETTQQNMGFWQMISAHCNEIGFTALKAAMGDNLVAMGTEANLKFSGVYRTGFYEDRPSVLPLGQDHSSLSAAQRATAGLGFFDKECPFDCTSGPGSNATSQNGANNNVGDSGYKSDQKGTWGAKTGDGINSNALELFRDNTEKPIDVDVWYPTNTNGVSYNGAAPKTTTITRWAQGTPSIGDEFQTYYLDKSGNKQAVFDAKNKTKQQNQRNYDDGAESYKRSTATQLAGAYDHFIVQASWASDPGKPQSLSFGWEYSPSVSSPVPSSVGITGSNVKVGSLVNRQTNVDGRCFSYFGKETNSTAENNTAKSTMNGNTGTGATTEFSTTNGDYKNARNLVLNFVRATGS